MDKAVFKRLVPRDRAAGRRLARGRAARWRDDPAAVLAELEAFAAGDRRPAPDGQAVRPRVVGRDDPRPRRGGVRRPRSTLAFRYDTLALVEAYLAGARDLEVSVIGNDHAQLELYGPGEIVAGHEFYDYAAKYTPGLSETSTAAEVPAAEGDRSSRSPATPTGRSAPRASPASTSSSPASGSVVSEINTIPGFTPISLFPTMPADGGYTFADVCERVVDLALERAARRASAAT